MLPLPGACRQPFGEAFSDKATLTVVTQLVAVAVFDDPRYVDTGGSTDSESDNLQASLTDLELTVETFTDILAATAAHSVLLFPEQEVNALEPALSAAERSALADFGGRRRLDDRAWHGLVPGD